MTVLNGFQLYSHSLSLSNILESLTSVTATQYYIGDALTLSTSGSVGLASQITTTQLPSHVYVSMETPTALLRPATANLSTTIGEKIHAVPVTSNILYFAVNLAGTGSAPTINGTAANSNSTTTSVLVTFTGSTNDFTGGQVYIPSLQEQATITADSAGGGVHTFTVYPAFSRAVTTGDTVIAVPWSKGATAIKGNATTPSQGISTAVADKSGGHMNIQDVFLGPILGSSGTVKGNFVPYAVVSFS